LIAMTVSAPSSADSHAEESTRASDATASDNSNNSWGTFFEGAIVLGYPSDETQQAVMDNVKAAG
jgi:hypothetical protein